MAFINLVVFIVALTLSLTISEKKIYAPAENILFFVLFMFFFVPFLTSYLKGYFPAIDRKIEKKESPFLFGLYQASAGFITFFLIGSYIKSIMY